MCTRGVPTTASSKILAGFVPPYDATVVERLERAGAVDHRQDQPRRVRDGLVDRELRARSVEESVGCDPHAGRIERRLGCGRGRAHRAACARVGHRRIDPAARGPVRHRRLEADLRPRVALRPAGVCLVARSDRPVRDHGRGRGARVPGDRRFRFARFDLVAGADARSRRRADRRCQGPPHRRAARVSRRRR